MKSFFFYLVFVFSGTLFAQTITGASPMAGAQGSWSLPVSITGSATNFSSATSTIVQFQQGSSQLEVLAATVTSPTQVNAILRIPYTSNTGLYDVKVFDQNLGQITQNNGFAVIVNFNTPSIIETYPDSVKQNATLPITISTELTNFSQATDNIIFLTQGTHTILPIPGSVQVLSQDSIRAVFNFAQPFLSVGSLLNSHCGNSFVGILSDFNSIEIVDSTLRIFENSIDVTLTAFPNPTNGELRVNLPDGLVNFQLAVYNQLGQKLYDQSVKNNFANTFTTNMESLPSGLYFIKIHGENRTYGLSIVKE